MIPFVIVLTTGRCSISKRKLVWINRIVQLVTIVILSTLLYGCGSRYRKVSLPTNRNISITLRYYLPSQENEDVGYGGYSYILIRQRPAAEELNRYYALLRAFVNCIQLEAVYISRFPQDSARLNITYWMLTDYLHERNVTKFEIDSGNAGYFIDNYDYVRAKNIIGNIVDFPETDGPFIVCSKYPLTSIDEQVGCRELLVFDLSKSSDYKGFKKAFDRFEQKVKSNPDFASGCVSRERFARLWEALKVDPPPMDIHLLTLLSKGAIP